MDALDARSCVLTIGAASPAAETGVFADVGAVAEAGCVPVGIVTAVVAGIEGPNAWVPVSSQVVGDQLQGLKGRPIDAVKVGAVADHASIDLVASEVRKLQVPVVLDPELETLKGSVNRAWLRSYREALIPAATVLVVDTAEGRELAQRQLSAAELVRALLGLGPAWVVLKAMAPDGDEHEDVISDGNSWFAVRSRHVPVDARGAGDVFSAALAARLARGRTVPEAASAAREQVVTYLGRLPVAG